MLVYCFQGFFPSYLQSSCNKQKNPPYSHIWNLRMHRYFSIVPVETSYRMEVVLNGSKCEAIETFEALKNAK